MLKYNPNPMPETVTLIQYNCHQQGKLLTITELSDWGKSQDEEIRDFISKILIQETEHVTNPNPRHTGWYSTFYPGRFHIALQFHYNFIEKS